MRKSLNEFAIQAENILVHTKIYTSGTL